jgi:hypothetical protein
VPWLSNFPVLQPTPVETSQPSINTQDMRYPRDPLYSVPTSWDPNSRQAGNGIGRHIAPQSYNAQNDDPHLDETQYSDGSEEEDPAPVLRGLGHSRRGPFKNIQDRQQTAETRKNKACIRCKMQRVRVWYPHTTPINCR